MKEYIQKIIDELATFEHNEKLVGEIQQWLLDEEHATEKEKALRKLWEDTEGEVDAKIWNSLSEVYSKVKAEQHKPQRKLLKMWQSVAAVVAVATLSVTGTYLLTKNTDSEVALIEHTTPAGEMQEITLPDGSRVQTNSGTMLLYPETFKGESRTVYLIGEANFKVQENKEKPFIVKSTTVSVTALGTEFNVAAYPENNEMAITLLSGKVQVDCNHGETSYILNPGEQVRYWRNTKKATLAMADLREVTAWQKGMFVFRGATVEEILSSLERRHDVRFQYNENLFNEDKYNLSFHEKTNLEDAMLIIQKVVGGFNYTLDKNICYIKAAKK